MRLAAGTRVGRYEVVCALGAGGMGEVYRARDSRLDRDVAVKVLPDSVSKDPDYLRRFDREARAASALDHPNVLVVHDVGTHEGSVYIVSELLLGETLRSRLAAGSLAPRKALEYGTQIARGLAAAHARGILHRDLKPENLFITKDGRVKILDFGLAKLRPPELAGSEMATATEATGPGTILGTLGYMSPEQVRGLPADERSDIFSLGAVLYEMVSGQRAFPGDTAADRASAILHQEPPELSTVRPEAPPALGRIVERCLEKEPEGRFHSAHDLTLALEAAAASASGAGLRGEAPAPRRALSSRVLLGLLSAVALGLSFVAGHELWPKPTPSFKQLTFRRGTVVSARFAPDGRTVFYSAAWEGGPVELFAVRPETPESQPLGVQRAEVLSTSSSGEMLVRLRKEPNPFDSFGTLARLPLAGGMPREILEDVSHADFAPNGQDFAVIHKPEARTRIELPIGHLVHETSDQAGGLRVSPRGDRLALVLDDQATSEVAVVDRGGLKKTLSSGWWGIGGLAWHPTGNEIFFAATREGRSSSLYAVTLSGKERLIAAQAGSIALQDIALDGRLLLTAGTERRALAGRFPGETSEKDLSWFDWSYVRDISPDGTRILFTEAGGGGRYFTYLRKTDGSPAVRLGEGASQALSPDGRWALALATGEDPQFVLLPTGPGQPRTLDRGSIESFRNPCRFLPDGKSIVFSGREPGRALRGYIQAIDGGKPRPIMPEGTRPSAAVSPDGRFVAAFDSEGRSLRWPLHGGSPQPIQGLLPMEIPIQWSGDGRSVFTVEFRPGLPNFIHRLDLATGGKQIVKELRPADPTGVASIGYGNVQITADGRYYAYDYPRILSQLYLVEGLR